MTEDIDRSNSQAVDLDNLPEPQAVRNSLGIMFEKDIDRLDELDDSCDRFNEAGGAVEDEDTAEKVTKLIKQYGTAVKRLTDDSVKVARKWKAVDGEIRDWGKKITEKSTKNKRALETALGKYMDAKRRAAEEEARQRKEEEIAKAVDSLQTAIAEGDSVAQRDAKATIELAARTESLRETVRTAGATASKRTVDVIEIVGEIDWQALGPFVDVADRDKAIRRAHKAGVQIGGVNIVKEERTVVR